MQIAKRSKLKIVIIVVVLLIIAGLSSILFMRSSPTQTTKAITASQNTKGEPTASAAQGSSNSDANGAQNNSDSQAGDEKNQSSTDAATNVNLLAPTGDFVSNHHPNLSGSPAPSTMTSVCTTTPGASCAISFTKDGVTKSLSSQPTDRGGATYWSWKLQDIGLTVGSWKIQATATLNGKTMTSTDAMNLEIAQ